MLLTLKQSAHQGFKSFHDYSPPSPPSSARFSPATTNVGLALPQLPSATKPTAQHMATPHRGLPPPAAMMPQPSPGPPPLGQAPQMGQAMGPLPPPPQQWQGAEDQMRNWLMAKAEEDKRKQEEEKTRQEGLRLEQRKIEQDMLRTSLNGGIPPYMIPMVFAGLSGGNLSHVSLEAAQHYMAQAQHQQQQLQQQSQQALPPAPPNSEGRRDSRQFYGGAQHPVPAPLPSTPIVPGQQQPAGFGSGYPVSPTRTRAQLPGPSALARLPPASELPRLNTNEMHIQQPPQTASGMQVLSGQSVHPLQQTQSVNPPQQESQSSGLYFHHWQPPTSQAGSSGSHQPSTPSDVPTSSPRKRKAQGPPPTSQPQHHSPPFSSHGGSSTTGTPSGRRQGHSRQRSDLSSRGMDSYGRPMSRHRHSESLVSSQSGVSPTQQQSFDSAPSGESRAGARRTSTPDKSDTRPPSQQERQPLPSAPELKSEESDPADRESSLRASSKRDDSRD